MGWEAGVTTGSKTGVLAEPALPAGERISCLRPAGLAILGPVKLLLKLLREGRPALVASLLFALTLCVYLPDLGNGFVNLDDTAYIAGNTHVRNGFSRDGLHFAFTSFDRGFWHPLTWMSIMLDCQIYGAHLWGHHLTSALLHAANAALLFLVLARMTGARWRSAMVAALFALHPQHVESVAWASERKDVLSTFFMLLALWAFVRYLGNSGKAADSQAPATPMAGQAERHWGFYALALAFFTCGLMSKAMVVTFPIILLLLDFWPLRRLQVAGPASTAPVKGTPVIRLLLEKVPFFLLSLAFGILTIAAQNESGAIQTTGRFPVIYRIENSLFSYGDYLGQMFAPFWLAAYYPHPKSFPLAMVALVGVVLLVVTLLALVSWRRFPFLTMGWIWYGVMLLPVIGLLQVGSQSHADRYTYMPMTGIFIILVWGFCELRARLHWPGAISGALASVALLACLILTERQITYWKDSETLFRRALAVTKDNEVAHNNLGTTLSRKRGRLKDAINEFQQAVAIAPDYAVAQGNLGAALFRAGKLDESILHSQKAVQLRPGFAGAHRNLGVAYGAKGQADMALKEIAESVRLEPSDPEGHYNLGVALINKGRYDEAIAQFQATLALDPENRDAAVNIQATQALKAQNAKKPAPTAPQPRPSLGGARSPTAPPSPVRSGPAKH